MIVVTELSKDLPATTSTGLRNCPLPWSLAKQILAKTRNKHPLSIILGQHLFSSMSIPYLSSATCTFSLILSLRNARSMIATALELKASAVL
jgi:hypothetical protein